MIFNLGSINADHFYRVPHLPNPGETLTAIDYSTDLGGKGANQSVAAVRAGSKVCHIGAVGPGGAWMVDRLTELGVDTQHIARIPTPSGHAIITIDALGENAIVIFPGANRMLDPTCLEPALSSARSGDWLMLQNETSLQIDAARIARDHGMSVAYSAAPFEVDAVRAVLPYISVLLLNSVEAQQLSKALSQPVEDIPVPRILITRGSKGATWIDRVRGETVSIPAFSVTPIDTTGAGDTFAGYLIAGLSQDLPPRDALIRAAAAAALKVQQKGTTKAIPKLDQVLAFLN